MTEQEAIERLELYSIYDFSKGSKEAMQMAIKALEEQIKIKMLGKSYIIPKNGVWEVNGVDIHKAIEKQIPKKPIVTGEFCSYKIYCCPCCREELYEDTEWGNMEFAYCTDCGQKLNWEEV